MLSLIFIVEQPRCSHRHDVNSFNREIAVFNLLHPRLSCHSLNLEYANGQPAFFNALRVNFIESRMAGWKFKACWIKDPNVRSRNK